MSVIGQGSALYIRDRRMGAHLFVVLTEPRAPGGRVVIVPIVTERSHTDKTVLLGPGDHHFIRHRSNVDYGAARYAFAERLAEMLSTGEASRAEDVGPNLLNRMLEGLLISSHTINEIAEYARATLGR